MKNIIGRSIPTQGVREDRLKNMMRIGGTMNLFDEEQNGWNSVPRLAETGQREYIKPEKMRAWTVREVAEMADQLNPTKKEISPSERDEFLKSKFREELSPEQKKAIAIDEFLKLNQKTSINEYWESEFQNVPDIAPKNHIQENKPMPSLLPMDLLIEYLEPAYREGLEKYHRESWRGGFPVSVMIDAAMRHIVEFFYHGANTDIDSSTKKHHLAGAIFSLICILWTLKTRPELDDRRKNGGVGRTCEQDKRTGCCDD